MVNQPGLLSVATRITPRETYLSVLVQRVDLTDQKPAELPVLSTSTSPFNTVDSASVVTLTDNRKNMPKSSNPSVISHSVKEWVELGET
jgi:hypothetical protein